MEWANNMPALNRTFLWTGLQMPSYSMLTFGILCVIWSANGDSIVFLIPLIEM